MGKILQFKCNLDVHLREMERTIREEEQWLACWGFMENFLPTFLSHYVSRGPIEVKEAKNFLHRLRKLISLLPEETWRSDFLTYVEKCEGSFLNDDPSDT